jgi:hypothetical protein
MFSKLINDPNKNSEINKKSYLNSEIIKNHYKENE